MWLGQPDLAIEHLTHAVRLSPLSGAPVRHRELRGRFNKIRSKGPGTRNQH